jgi:hypothetical protein
MEKINLSSSQFFEIPWTELDYYFFIEQLKKNEEKKKL